MKEATERAAEILNESGPTEKEIQDSYVNLKVEINSLLHCYLPGSITLDESEVLAIVINEMICNPKEFLNKAKLLNQ